jgi:alkyl hydroperoxide reductase subunit AhpC
MAPAVGSRIPDLEVVAYVPGALEPQMLGVPARDGGWTALVFYARDFGYVHPTDLHGFAELQDEFAAEGVTLLAASTDSYYTHKAWFESNALLSAVRYPVLADASQELTSAFGVLGDDGAALSGTFLIDPEGVVRHVSADPGPAETLRMVRSLREWRPEPATLSVAA